MVDSGPIPPIIPIVFMNRSFGGGAVKESMPRFALCGVVEIRSGDEVFVAMLEIASLTAWVVTIAAIVIFVQAVVRISQSFAEISRSLNEIALTLRQRDLR